MMGARGALLCVVLSFATGCAVESSWDFDAASQSGQSGDSTLAEQVRPVVAQHHELSPYASTPSESGGAATAEAFRFDRVIIDPIHTDWLPEEVVIGDVTGDRRPDIVMTMSYSGFWPEPDVYALLRIYEQAPNGSLRAPIQIKRKYIGGLDLLDLDHDDASEIVFAENNAENVAESEPMGGLTVVTRFGTQFVPRWYAGHPRLVPGNGNVASIDANGDGHMDLFMQTPDLGAQFFLGDGFGGIGGLTHLETSWTLGATVEASDFTADGSPDIVVQTAHVVRIYPSRWKSSMGPRIDVDLSAVQVRDPNGLTVADMDQNGRPDLVFSDQGDNGIPLPKGIRIMYRGPGNSFTRSILLDTTGLYTNPSIVRVADVDGNGYPDIVTMFDSYDRMGYFLQGPTGFAPVVYQQTDDNPWTNNFYRDNSFAIGDVNSDGCLDVVLAELSSSLRIFYGRNCQKPVPRTGGPLRPLRSGG